MKWKIEICILMLPTLKKLDKKINIQWSMDFISNVTIQKNYGYWFFFLLLELENVLTPLKDFTLNAYNI
jgi:hypothetical protein